MELTLKLTKEEAQIILDSLVQQSYAKVAGVVDKIQNQAAEQLEKVES